MKTPLSSRYHGLMMGVLTKDADFEEGKHPRDERGRFASGEGAPSGMAARKTSFRQPGTPEQRVSFGKLIAVPLEGDVTAFPTGHFEFLKRLQAGKLAPEDLKYFKSNTLFYRSLTNQEYGKASAEIRKTQRAYDEYASPNTSNEGLVLRDRVRAAANEAFRPAQFGKPIDPTKDKAYVDAQAAFEDFKKAHLNRDPERYAALKADLEKATARHTEITSSLKGYNALVRAAERTEEKAAIAEVVGRKGIPPEAERFSSTQDAESHLTKLGVARVELGAMSPEVASTIASEMDDLEKEFPGLAQRGIKEIAVSGKGSITRRMGRGRYAEMYMALGVMRISSKYAGSYGVLLKSLDADSEGKNIRVEQARKTVEEIKAKLKEDPGLGPKFLPSLSYLEKQLEAEEKAGRAAWHDGMTDPRSVITHEVGHRLHHMLWNIDPEINNFLAANRGQAHQITGYAASNSKEFFAEMFSAHKYGDEKTKNHPVMKEFSEKIYPRLKESWITRLAPR